MTSPMLEVWSFSREGERYHIAARRGSSVYVVYSDTNRKRQGVLRLDVESGDFERTFISPEYPVIHDMVCGESTAILLVGNRVPGRFVRASSAEELRIEAFAIEDSEPAPLWREVVANESHDELPDVSVALDSGKLYIARGAMLEVRDGLSGRVLGELTLPGLDERVDWKVSQGAGFLAEETRASVFELPA